MEKWSEDRYTIIWIHEEQVYGVIVTVGTYASLVKYNKDGIEYKTYLENDEFTILDEIGFGHIEEYDGEDPLL